MGANKCEIIDFKGTLIQRNIKLCTAIRKISKDSKRTYCPAVFFSS